MTDLCYNICMDQYGYQGGGNIPPQQYYMPPRRQSNGMMAAALVMAGAAVISILSCVGPLFFGSLAILFAILSKGKEPKMKPSAIGSIVLSLLSIFAGAALLFMTIRAVQTDPAARAQLDGAFEMMYGVDYDEFSEGMKQYYETGEIPEFLQEPRQQSPYYYPGGSQL